MPYLDLNTYGIQNANKTWSYTTNGNNFRFELHSGDHWQNDKAGIERSEIASYKTLDFGQIYTVDYKFMIEPGSLNTAKWLTIGQFHASEDKSDGGVSPPYELDLVGDRMQIDARWSTPTQTNWSNVNTRTLYTDTHNIQRGHWYDIKITIKFDPFGNGMLDVWRDGVQLVDYSGPLGYNDSTGPYWKEGIYRQGSSETMAVNYSGFTLVKGSVVGTGTGTSPGIIHGTIGDDNLYGTDGPDSILGGDGRDLICGGPGNDFLDGQGGDNVLYGGSGDDVIYGLVGINQLSGEAGNDRLVSGTGQNYLYGGGGSDVFDFNALDQRGFASNVIMDFQHSLDKIDLYDIDANSTVSGNQSFHFVGGNPFDGKAGELRFSEGILTADVNGDKVADLHIIINNAKVTADDLIL